MDELDSIIKQINDEFGEGTITTANEIPRPERALEKQAIDDFMDRNPMMDGGMLVKPSADGSRPGYARIKGVKGGSDYKPLTKKNVKLLKTRYADEIKNTKGGYEKWRADPKNSWKISGVRKGNITADTPKKPEVDLDALEKIIERTNKENKIYSKKEISKIYFDEKNVKQSRIHSDKANKIFEKILPPEEKVNRVIEQMLISDEPLPEITFKSKDANAKANWRKYIINEVGEGKGDGLKKLLKNNKFYKKNAEVLNYMFNIRNDIEGMTFKDALDYATKAKKGMPRLSGMKGNFSFSPVYRTMDFAFRNWDANKGKGLVKFFDKNGKPITWSPGLKKLDYNTVSFSKGGKQTFSVNGKYNNSISIRADGEQFFPKVFEAVKTRNALLDTKVDDPFRKGKQILFSELINKIQVKGYGWSPDKKQVLEILHGPDGVAGNPFDNLKVGTSKLNNTLSTLDSIPIKGLKNKIMNQAYGQLKGLRGERLTKAIIDQQLEIGAKVAAGQTFPISDRTQIFMDALDPEKEILGPLSQKEKTFIETKLKNPAVRLRNIETTEAIDNLLASFSANPKCRITFGKKAKAAANGGRIGYATGPLSLTDCADSGRQRLEKVIKTGVKLGPQEGALATQILKAGRGLGSAFALRNILGPAAIGFTVLAEAGLVGYDMLSEGKTFREAVGDSLFNYALGEKTKIDPQEELFKRFEGLGYDNQQMFRIKKALDTANTINTGINLGMDIVNQKAEVDKLGKQYEQDSQQIMMPEDEQMQSDQLFRAQQKEKDLMNQMSAFNQDLSAVAVGDTEAKEDILNKYIQSGDYAQGLELFSNADRLAEIQKTEKALENPFAGRLRIDELSNKLRELKLNDPRIREYMGPFPTTYGFSNGGYGKKAYDYLKEIETDHHKGYQYYKRHGGKKSFKEYMKESMSKYFAGGGIAKLAGVDQGPPPESGPNSQGLQGLLNRVKKT